ncbi:single-strand DNA endonuclease ASTE1-like [Mytilus galloprovincialis]|uniref:single-strand DNA endonuclease ASTE1-like n=1 Tax=Mytilus galloprovincialis TaxID=29158 RepID=UPI003F7C533D
MGVPSIIVLAKKNPSFWEVCDFRDIKLVIDGNCLYNLLYEYLNIDTIGNFSEYAEKVEMFFKWLFDRRITPYVVFDGAYDIDDKKIETLKSRSQQRAANPEDKTPILAKITFTKILEKLRIQYIKCDFEADRDIQMLANDLKCPVLSRDSDFFIFDVHFGYIPFDSLPLSAIFDGTDEHEIKIYFIENLWKKFPYLRGNMALLATALGNDYLSKHSNVLQNAYHSDNFRLPKCKTEVSDLFEIPCEAGEPFFITIRKVLYWICRYNDADREKRQLLYFCKKDKREEEMLTRSLKVFTEPDDYTSYNLYDLLQERESVGLDRSAVPSHVPTWIIDSHRRGFIPDFFLNTLIHKRVFLLSQVEGTHDLSSHECSLSIRKVIYALLLGTDQSVTEHDRYRMSLCEFQRTGVICVTGLLRDPFIPNMPRELKIKILGAALCCQIPSESICGSLGQTRLFLMITTYWARVAEPTININFLKSVLISYLLFSTIKRNEFRDRKIDFRDDDCLNQRKSNIDGRKGANSSKGATTLNSNHSGSDVRLKDLYYAVTQFAGRDVKTKKDYIPNIIHTFAQFQSCILYITYLNQLLNSPLENVNPAFVFNGKFLHDMDYTLRKMKQDIIGHFLASEKNHFERFYNMLQFVQDNVYIQDSE